MPQTPVAVLKSALTKLPLSQNSAIGLGIFIGVGVRTFYNRRYKSHLADGGGYLQPEARLAAAKVGGVLLPVSLFRVRSDYYD